MRPWWVWVIGIASILVGIVQLSKNVMSIIHGFPAGLNLIPVLFLGISIVAGVLWMAGGIGFLQRRAWGRTSLVAATMLEFVRSILSVISFFVLVASIQHPRGWLITIAIAVSILWIGGLFFFARFLRGDKVRKVMVA